MILTNKEKIALRAIAENGLHGMGGDVPDDLLCDNFSWFYPEDIVKRTNFSKAQVAGLIRSLDEKGLIAPDKKNEWFLLEEGIIEAQKIWEK